MSAVLVRVYCGNNTRWRGLFEEPEECSWEGDIEVHPEEVDFATFTCPGCGGANAVRDHEQSRR